MGAFRKALEAKKSRPAPRLPSSFREICRGAGAVDAIFEQLLCEARTQLVIVSEPYQIKTTPYWFYDRLGTAAVWIPTVVKSRS